MTRTVLLAPLVFTLIINWLPQAAFAQPAEIFIEGPLDSLPAFPPQTTKSVDKIIPEQRILPHSAPVQQWLDSTADHNIGIGCSACNFDPYACKHLYGSISGGVFNLNLPSFRYFQELGGTGSNFVDTEDGDGHASMISAAVGVVIGDPLRLNGRARVELGGMYSERQRQPGQTLSSDTGTVGWSAIDGSGISNFAAALPTRTSRELTVGQADLLLKYDFSSPAGSTITPYLGASFLQLVQSFRAAELTTGMTLSDDLNARYVGGTVGLELMQRLPRNCTITFNGGVSLYDLDCQRTAQQLALGTAISLVDRAASRHATQVRLQLELMHKVGRAQVFVYGGAQYLSAVPLVSYTPGVASAPSTIAFDDAWGFSAGGGVRMPF